MLTFGLSPRGRTSEHHGTAALVGLDRGIAKHKCKLRIESRLGDGAMDFSDLVGLVYLMASLIEVS